MNKIVIGVVAGVVVVGGVYASMMNNKDGSMMMDKKMEEKVMMKDEMMKGSYEAYSPEKIAKAEKGDVVLFFHASWCPSCRGLSSDIESNMSSIPEGVTILKVDYDKEVELKKKYGVTSQHTLVQVDKDGNLIKKWSGGSSLSALVSEIQ
jgi:thiol-disulfide isomerase/thioredoxin